MKTTPEKEKLVKTLVSYADVLDGTDRVTIASQLETSLDTVRRYLNGKVAKAAVGRKMVAAIEELLQSRLTVEPMSSEVPILSPTQIANNERIAHSALFTHGNQNRK